jgi:chromosome segregation ATPase
MADQLRLRGGDTASSATFVGALREVTVDTGLNALRIHDGVTPGGHLVELSASAAASRSVVAADSATNLEAVRAALQQAIDDAIAARDAADAATLTSANSYTDTKVTEVLGGAPDLLDTLNELAEAIGDDSDFITTINASIAAVQADVDANEAAAEQARNDLNTSLQGIIDAIEADVDANEATAAAGDAATLASANAYTDTAISDLTNGADAALDTLKEIGDALAAGDADVTTALTASITSGDSALSARLDVLETDPVTLAAVTSGDTATLSSANTYTDTQVASGDATVTNNLTALITAETNTRAADDAALDARIDVLEVDPTTATALNTAVAGVQADVDQNEADADTAISAEETRALAAEAAITAAQDAEEAARNQLNLHAGLAFGQLYVGDLIVA